VVCHVDDLNISLTEKDVVEDILKLTRKFGKYVPLTTSRGKVLD